MMNSSTHNGGQRVADRGNKALSMEVVKLLKTQDAAYLRTVAQKTRRARERLEEEFVLSGEGEERGVRVLGKEEKAGQKVVWVGNKEEQKRWGQENLEGESDEVATGRRDGDNEEDIEAPFEPKEAPPKALIEAQKSALHEARALRKRHKRQQEVKISKLEALKVREKSLMAAELELEMQRAKMSSSVGGVTKAGLKWKVRERKR